MASEFLPRVPKKVEGTSKYYFGWKDEKKKDTDDATWNADKQLQVETGRLAAHYLGEFERALAKWKKTHEKETKTNSPKDTEWADAENLVNMYTIYKISKDMYDTIPDAKKAISESTVEIQTPGMLFGYSVRERKLNLSNKDIADFAVFLENESPWIQKNLLLQYPIRKYKNDVRQPIVLKKANIIFSGSSENPNTHEFPGGTAKRYDILADLLKKNPSIKNAFTIEESAITTARNGTYKLFLPENGQPFRISKESDFLGAPALPAANALAPASQTVSTTSPLITSALALMHPSPSTQPTIPASFASMAGQKNNSNGENSNSNSNTNSTSSSSSSNSNTNSTSSSNSNTTKKVNEGGAISKKKSHKKRMVKHKIKSKSKTKSKKKTKKSY